MSFRAALRISCYLLATFLPSTAAQAQLFRAYVASTGNDVNPCTLPQPCRLLPAALSAVASGGEIWMLDSANYNSGPVNIAKSVTILAVPGALGSVVAAGGNAMNINTAGVNVALRNLVVVPLPGGGGVNGIVMNNGAMLTVENCLFAALPATGIYVNTPAIVRVSDTTIRDNAFPGLFLGGGARATVTRAIISRNGEDGIWVHGNSSATTTSVDIADSTLDGNRSGVWALSSYADAQLKISVRDSRLVQNSQTGILGTSTAGGSVTVSASNNLISNNGAGIFAQTAGVRIWASGNEVSGNDPSFGFGQQLGSIFESAGNNSLRNNAIDAFGTVTVPAPAMR